MKISLPMTMLAAEPTPQPLSPRALRSRYFVLGLSFDSDGKACQHRWVGKKVQVVTGPRTIRQ